MCVFSYVVRLCLCDVCALGGVGCVYHKLGGRLFACLHWCFHSCLSVCVVVLVLVCVPLALVV